MEQIISIVNRILFIIAFVFAGVAVWEKVANMMGMTLTRGYYSNWQFLELAVVALLFVIALQLREIKLGNK
ncbi:MAG: hypothetical protein RRA35_10240 [Desulfomonilia bacterium]|nr:hypothetical protein [Desulfomonilia bacterium]